MAKCLLTLLLVITTYAFSSAQKLSLASNYTLAPSRSVLILPDSGNIKPLLTAKKSVPGIKAINLIKKSNANVALELVEETAQLRLQGRQDAKAYYKPRAVFWGTMGTTLLYPAAGLAIGAVVSVMPPSINDEIKPNAHLMKEPAYEEAFKKQAHRKRFGNAAAGFGVGIAVLGVVYKVVVSGL